MEDEVVVGAVVAEAAEEAVKVVDTKLEVVDTKLEVVDTKLEVAVKVAVEVAAMDEVEVEGAADEVLTSIMGSMSLTLHGISVLMNGIDYLKQECYPTSMDSASM
jgi:Ca2+/H+ antiporter